MLPPTLISTHWPTSAKTNSAFLLSASTGEPGAEPGPAVRHGVLERSQRAGVASIEPADGLRLLRLLLDTNLTQVLASPVDWSRWAEHSKAEAAANSDLLDGLPAIGNQDGPIAAAFLDEVVAEAFTPPGQRLLLAGPACRFDGGAKTASSRGLARATNSRCPLASRLSAD